MAGTHWVWEIVHMLVSGRAEYEARTKEHLMVEMVELDTITSQPSPRFINSHLRLRHLPRELVTKRSKVIHLTRNPKDIVVSLYFHMTQMKHFPQDLTITTFVEDWLKGWDYPGICLYHIMLFSVYVPFCCRSLCIYLLFFSLCCGPTHLCSLSPEGRVSLQCDSC